MRAGQGRADRARKRACKPGNIDGKDAQNRDAAQQVEREEPRSGGDLLG
ncbi:hypothetical protein [Novosphingobium sp. MBES04]|nr:hypothetical protein [Novosphingobium sp. MBES04]GAM05709.1 hypothetical protein MBENS4_2707 [Novosphingobium sp. MBES04]